MSLKSQAISGTIWTAVASTTQAIIQILRLSLLTRFLEKSDFGLIAIVVLILGFTQIFTDLGISVSLFSRHDISKNEYSSLYWVSMLLGTCLYGLVFISAPLFAAFYNQPELAALIPIMGLDLIFATAGRQFRIFRQKALKFKSLAIIDVTTALFSLGIAVFAAYRGERVWSIVYSTLFASFASSFLLIVTGLKTHPLSFYINFKEGKSFYKTGLFQTGSQILDYVASQLDILIIGKLMSTSDLGVYNLIKQLVMRVYGLLNPIITRVSIPVLATLNENLPALKEKFLYMLKLTSFINFAIYGLIAFLAKEVLLIMYGSSFTDFHFILQIFCLWGALISVMNASSSLITATGRTALGFRWTTIRLIVNPVLIVVGYQFGLIGIVLAQATYTLIFYNAYWKLVVNQILKILSYREYLFSSLRYAVHIMILLVFLINLKNFTADYFINIWINISAYAALFISGYLLANEPLVRDVLGIYFLRKQNK